MYLSGKIIEQKGLNDEQKNYNAVIQQRGIRKCGEKELLLAMVSLVVWFTVVYCVKTYSLIMLFCGEADAIWSFRISAISLPEIRRLLDEKKSKKQML